MKNAQKSWIALALALIELSLLPIFLSIGGNAIGGTQLLFYVFLTASIVSLTVSIVYDRNGLIAAIKSKKGLAIIIIAGLCNNTIAQTLLTYGTLGTNPSIGGIMYRGWVLIAALLIPVFLRTKVTKAQLGALLLGFLGMYVIVSNGAILSLNTQQLPYMAMLLGSAIAAAIALLLMRFYTVSTTASIAIFNIVSVSVIGVIAFSTNTSLAVTMTPTVIGIILFLGTATFGIGTTLYYHAYKTLNPVFVGNATLVVPFMTIIFASVLAGTTIQPYYILSIILIAAAVLLQQRFSSRAPERVRSKAGSSSKFQMFDVTSAFVNNRKIINQIGAENRALAIKIPGGKSNFDGYKSIFEMRDCIGFTTLDPYEGIGKDEIDFVNDIMAPQGDEVVLMGIGKPDQVEISLEEFINSQK